MNRVASRAVMVLLPFILAGYAFALPQDTVDFTKPPAKGLKYKVIQKRTGQSETTLAVSDREPREISQTTSGKMVFTQTILEVKDGKIVKLDRVYEEAGSRTENDQMPEPREQENPLAWKHIRAEWNEDGECKVEIKEGDEWTEPEDKMKRRLRPQMLRNPLIPLPEESKKVGDSWELDEEAAKKFFGKPPTLPGEDAPEIEREAKFKITGITDFKEMKCAVIKMVSKISVDESMSQTMEATCYYSLKHCIIVGMKGTGTNRVNRTMERGEMIFEIDSSGTQKINAEVKILGPESQDEE